MATTAVVGKYRESIGKAQPKLPCYAAAPRPKVVGAGLKIFQSVLVTAKNLPGGAKLDEEDLLLVQAKVTSLRHPPLIDLS